MFDLFARIEFINDIIDKFEQFANQIFDRNFFLFAQIEQFSVETVTNRPPFVFLNQTAVIKPEAEIFVDQSIKFGNDRLKKRGDGDRVVNARRNVADAKFERREKRMRANIPLNLCRVLHTVHLDEQIDIALKLLVRFEMIGNVGARKFFENFRAITFQSRVKSEPERRTEVVIAKTCGRKYRAAFIIWMRRSKSRCRREREHRRSKANARPSAVLRREICSGRLQKSFVRDHFENGCVEAATISIPFFRASEEIIQRSFVISSRAS